MQLWDSAWLNFFVPDSSSESLQTVRRQNWRLLGSGMGTKILCGLKLSSSPFKFRDIYKFLPAAYSGMVLHGEAFVVMGSLVLWLGTRTLATILFTCNPEPGLL